MAKEVTAWIKRKQELLAMQSREGQPFGQLYPYLGQTGLIRCALEQILDEREAGAAGVDGVTKDDWKTQDEREALVHGIVSDMRRKAYRPRPVRQVYDSPDGGEPRPRGMTTIRDRVVQAAIRLLLDPIYESRFHRHSYGFRPFRSSYHAALRAKDLLSRRGYDHVVVGRLETGPAAIEPRVLLKILRRTITDERLVRVIGRLLRAGVIDFGGLGSTGEATGTTLAPLLANVYLHELDRFIDGFWATVPSKYQQRYRAGRYPTACPCYIVRHADEFVILTKSRADAERMQRETATFLRDKLGLELSADRTRIVKAEAGFDLREFNIRRWDRRTLVKPSKAAVTAFRRALRERVEVAFSLDDVAAIAYLNQFLIGWAMYYRRVSSSGTFRYLDHLVWQRVFKTSLRRRGDRRATRRGHYKQHYIAYRHDVKASNRRHRGRHYGAWLDGARTQALIVVRMAFVRIRYSWLHPQLHPYIAAERRLLEDRVETINLPSTGAAVGRTAVYGTEWRLLRRIVLGQAHHRCQQCGERIDGRSAHVHHLRPWRQRRSRKQANQIDNLMAVCPRCHARLEARLRAD